MAWRSSASPTSIPCRSSPPRRPGRRDGGSSGAPAQRPSSCARKDVPMRTEYSFDDLLAEHPYERPLVLDGVPCHGGFVGGRYVSPRTLRPAGALAAVLDPISARVPPHFPSVGQTKLLVRHGVTVPLVRILSIIAIVEGFGGEVLRQVTLPRLRERVIDPVDGTALAHLGPLFEAHARDEAGHRRMWELARDIALDRP